MTNSGLTYREADFQRKRLEYNSPRAVVLSPDHPAILGKDYPVIQETEGVEQDDGGGIAFHPPLIC